MRYSLLDAINELNKRLRNGKIKGYEACTSNFISAIQYEDSSCVKFNFCINGGHHWNFIDLSKK